MQVCQTLGVTDQCYQQSANIVCLLSHTQHCQFVVSYIKKIYCGTLFYMFAEYQQYANTKNPLQNLTCEKKKSSIAALLAYKKKLNVQNVFNLDPFF
jgi:hypothetical protein